MQLNVGDVYEPGGPDKRPIRVLMFDEIVVYYDTWWPEGGWTLSRFWRSAAFYRMATDWVVTGTRIRQDPISDKERERYRLDLPLRIHRHPSLNWAHLEAETPEQATIAAATRGVNIAEWPALKTEKVTLIWFPRWPSATMLHTTVAATSGGEIVASDLLWHAQRLVSQQVVDGGIGLFRLGLHRGVPSYSVWGSHDPAGGTWRHEHGTTAGGPPEWKIQQKAVTGSYPERLKAMKRQFPFKQWRAGAEGGLEQYSKENCAVMAAIFDKLIKRLIALGEKAPEADKLAAFQEAIEATNVINEREMNLIETGEREQLCDLCNEIARAAGMDPTQYGGGEGPASEWRDW